MTDPMNEDPQDLTHQEQSETPSISKRKRKILSDFITGVLITILLVLGKIGVEHTYVGHRVELLTYEFLHRRLSAFDPSVSLPVVVLDISKLPGGKDGSTTPRKQLQAIIDALLETEPRGIAIDLNFSPDRKSGRWQSDDDPDFLSYLRSRSTSEIPIYVGVVSENVAPGDPALWLGATDFKSLAAYMDINDEDTTRLPLWVRCGSEKLFSFSGKLAQAMDRPEKQSSVQRLLFKDLSNEEHECGKQCRCAYTLANYAKLETIQAQSLPIITADAIKNAGEKFHERFVLAGDGILTHAQDPFVVVGREKPVSGVYLHAVALYTLVGEPLYLFTDTARLIIDVLLAVAILSFIALLRWQHLRDEHFGYHQPEKALIWFTAIFVFVAGILLIQWLHIIWLDFVLVIVALVLHPPVSGLLGHLKRTRKPAPDPHEQS
jgi:CHASE2 domain-containing sensor protein